MIEYDLNILKDGTLNKYINAERRNRFIASKLKKQLTYYCFIETQKAINQGLKVDWPCLVQFNWSVPNKRTDPDNWAFLKKFIFDGMQKAKKADGTPFLDNDNMANIIGFHDSFEVDKNRPRVRVVFIND